MKPRNPRSVLAKAASLLIGWLFAATAWAGVGLVTHLSGLLSAQKAAGAPKILAINSEVDEGDTLVTQDKTFARIKFSDGGNLVLRPNSRVKIDRYSYQADKPEGDNVAIDLLKGGLRSITGVVGKRSRDRHTTTTANATIGIRGTHFGLIQCLDEKECEQDKTLGGDPLRRGLYIDVLEGRVSAANPAGTLEVGPGQFGYVASPKDPPVLLPEKDGARATVPPSMASDTGGGMTVGQNGNDNKCEVK